MKLVSKLKAEDNRGKVTVTIQQNSAGSYYTSLESKCFQRRLENEIYLALCNLSYNVSEIKFVK